MPSPRTNPLNHPFWSNRYTSPFQTTSTLSNNFSTQIQLFPKQCVLHNGSSQLAAPYNADPWCPSHVTVQCICCTNLSGFNVRDLSYPVLDDLHESGHIEQQIKALDTVLLICDHGSLKYMTYFWNINCSSVFKSITKTGPFCTVHNTCIYNYQPMNRKVTMS